MVVKRFADLPGGTQQSRLVEFFREIEISRTSNKSADALALTTELFAIFEEWIREHPEQWMWWNTRWVKDDGTLLGKADRQ